MWTGFQALELQTSRGITAQSLQDRVKGANGAKGMAKE